MEFDIHKIFIIAFLTSAAEGNEFITMSQISEDMENILYSVKSPTITHCHMLCNKESKCKTIGVTKESDGSPLYNCYLLKKNDDTPKKASNEAKKVDSCQKGTNESKLEPKETISKEEKNDVSTKAPNEDKKVEGSNDKITALKWKEHVFVDSIERTVEYKEWMANGNLTTLYKMLVQVKQTKDRSDDINVVWLRGIFKVKALTLLRIDFRKDESFLIESTINGTDYKHKTDVYPLNKWISIDVSQIKHGENYIFSVLIDGKEVYSTLNTQPKESIDNVYGTQSSMLVTPDRTTFVRNIILMIEN